MRYIDEVSPPGWGHTKTGGKKGVKVGGTAAAMKKAKAQGRIPKGMNIFALMWSMKKKGADPHYKHGKKGVLKKKFKGPKGQNEERKIIMNDNDYEMIGESIWDTYRNMASILAEAGFGGAPEVKGLKRFGLRATLAKRARKLGPKGREEEGSERSEKGRRRRAAQLAQAEDQISAAQDI